jgi:ElaB/YqjD/DUF883 family membrane-anchored ribosome-binding protein
LDGKGGKPSIVRKTIALHRQKALEGLLVEIDLLRENLEKTVRLRGSMSDAEVVALSARLDSLLNRYYRQSTRP